MQEDDLPWLLRNSPNEGKELQKEKMRSLHKSQTKEELEGEGW
jgi:hypothetical protein